MLGSVTHQSIPISTQEQSRGAMFQAYKPALPSHTLPSLPSAAQFIFGKYSKSQ